MDPRKNPFAPGAGTPPPELAGRSEIIEKASITLDRIRGRKPDRSLILYGLCGVGKTVLLNRIRSDADEHGFVTVKIESPEGKSLPALLIPALRAALIRLDRGQALRAGLERAKRALAGFAGAFKLKFADVEVAIDFEPQPGLADSGDLEVDLTDLVVSLGEAAAESGTAFVIFIDELQYVEEAQLASLISALHEASQKVLPITLVGAGLPQLLGKAGRAKSYAERLFEYLPVDRLDRPAATAALAIPVRNEGAEFSPEALDEIIAQTRGYPYFLQEWGKHSWALAEASPIRHADARAATRRALAELDASFFLVRFDRLTPKEKQYLRAMADLGDGPHRSGDIALRLGRTVSSVAPTRASLIAKGMVYSKAHGDTGFTVPLFADFMKRIMP